MYGRQEAGLVISPMGIGEVLDAGFNLARRHYRWLVGVTAWGAVPSYALLALGSILTGMGTQESSSAAAAVLGGGIATLCFAVGTTVTSAALIIACGRIIAPTGNPEEWTAGDLYGEAAGRIFAILRMGLLYLVTAIPLAIVFPLGVFVWVRWSVALVATLIEGTGARASLGRSWHLTKGSWWHTAIVVIGSSFIVGILSGMVGGLFGGGGALLGLLTGNKLLESVLSAAGQGLGFVLVEAFSVAILTVLYFELRARTEGYDLERRGLEIAAGQNDPGQLGSGN